MTVNSFYTQFKTELKDAYPKEEKEALAAVLLGEVLGLSRTEIVMKGDLEIEPDQLDFLLAALKRLKADEPIQYILGKTEFYGLEILLSPDVLIPRPETEELVHWIIRSNEIESPKIVDFGTGSGCIPLALKSEIPKAEVRGVDKSAAALEIALKNAGKLSLEIQFKIFDILGTQPYPWQSVDILVSNPPYVRFSERQSIKPNVLNFEPDIALFVGDSDPLIFYRKIAEIGNSILTPRGQLFFEINEIFGKEIQNLLKEKGYTDIELRKDLNGKDRMVRAFKV